MIREGKHGSFNLYFKGKFISSFPIHKFKDIEDYKYQGTTSILNGFKNPLFCNYKIKDQIKAYLLFCNKIYTRKINNQSIRRSDHELFLASMMALEKLKIIDSEYDIENGYFICPKKKLPKK